MPKGLEFCPIGNCPTITATAEGTGAVVQGVKRSNDRVAVYIPIGLLDAWNPAQDAVTPGEGNKVNGLRGTSDSVTMVRIEGTPFDARPGSVPPHEGLVFLPKTDLVAR